MMNVAMGCVLLVMFALCAMGFLSFAANDYALSGWTVLWLLAAGCFSPILKWLSHRARRSRAE